MDSVEEPQKKVFKARKTMRASDRQQLDAVHRVKGELLRADGKLLNGSHENGDLDPTSPLENTDCIQDREEVNGIDGICFQSEESTTEWKETPCMPNVAVKNKQEDLNSEALSPSITCDLSSRVTTEPASGSPASDNPGCGTPVSDNPASDNPASDNPASDNPDSGDLAAGELATTVQATGDSACEEPPSSDPSSSDPTSSEPSSSEPTCSEPISGDPVSEEAASHDLVSGDSTCGEPVSGEPVSHEAASSEPATSEPASDEPVARVVAACELAPGESALDDCAPSGDSQSDEPPSSEDSLPRSVCSGLASGELTPGELSVEPATDTVKPSSSAVCEAGPDPDKTEPSSNNSDDCPGKSEDDEHLDQIQSKDSCDEGNKVNSNVVEKEEPLETHSAIICSDLPPENTTKIAEDPIAEPALEEEAISSSMEVDQSEKDEHKSPAEPVAAVSEDPAEEDKEDTVVDNTDSMETDEIIPILEKLAPTEDELSCFSKASLLPVETSQDLEDKMEGSFGSPSKQESSENLPKEAFLVLSDEEDLLCGKDESEAVAQTKMSTPG